jgi:GNAT superfamily N-acetyltransferase
VPPHLEALRDLPPGWATDIAVLQHGGALVEERGDHLVVRTPSVPDYHWGNCIFVTDADAVDDADRFVAAFRAAFPAARWIAIGLARLPDDAAAWTGHGVELELDEVLSTRTLPRQTPLAQGYVVRPLAGDDDWEQVVRRGVAENAETDAYEPASHEIFLRGRAAQQRAMCERGVAAFFGAFADGRLVADLGIVICGQVARYQSVGTDVAHRRRGLCSHLLGVAARFAHDAGCRQWVIITEATNPAGRVYRSVGFEPDEGNAQAYRPPPR